MIETRKMKNCNEEALLADAFLADVSGICWEQILTGTDDIDVLVNNWSKPIFFDHRAACPMRRKCVSQRNTAPGLTRTSENVCCSMLHRYQGNNVGWRIFIC